MKLTANTRITVIGLGYVGLPLAIAFAKHYQVVGFDINQSRIDALSKGIDNTGEADPVLLKQLINNHSFQLTTQPKDLDGTDIFIVTVPTPINEANQPDLTPLLKASELIGAHIKKGAIAIYESTTYPTCTETFCAPVIEKVSGLHYNQDFFCGYSPERINPADKNNRLENIRKITSGSTPEVADLVDSLYNSILINGTHRAPCMAVAEMAKAIENAQRDTNIAFVNEVAMMCSHLGIDSQAVLDAAGTKWNFIHMKPGLVGGHCISVDPYYLQYIGNIHGYTTDVINAARRTNNQVPHFISGEMVKLMMKRGKTVKDANVLIMGCTFKENCPDIRNSKVFDIIADLQELGIKITIIDPHALTPTLPKHLQTCHVAKLNDDSRFDAILVCVAHEEFADFDFKAHKAAGAVIYDIKHVVDPKIADLQY